MTAAAPVEQTIFRQDHAVVDMHAISRPCYALLLMAADFATVGNVTAPTGTLAFAGLFASLPLLWMFGVTPTLEGLVPWAAEQFLVIVAGGSPMASDRRLLVMSAASAIAISVTGVLLAGSISASAPATAAAAVNTTDITAAVAFAAAAGVLLSSDLLRLLRMLIPFDVSTVAPRRNNKVAPIDAGDALPASSSNFSTGGGGGGDVTGEYLLAPLPPWWQRALLWGRVGGYIACTTLVYDKFNLAKVAAEAAAAASASGNDTTADVGAGSRVAIDGLVMGTCGLLFFTHQAQQAFIFGGLVRNPMHPAAMDERSAKRAKAPLRIVGWIHRTVLAVAPFVAGSYVSVLHSNAGATDTAIVALGLARAYRWACQSTSSALLEASVASALHYAVAGASTAGTPTVPRWSTVPLVLQLMLIGLILDRLSDLQSKLNFVGRMFHASWTVKALRIKHTKTILILSGVFFPVVLAVILFSVALGAPLLPLFGLPVFVVGFPRPKRFWPEPGVGSSPSADSVYYKHASPALSAYLETAFATGVLGRATPGEHLLLRYQDNFVWVQVLERGLDFTRVSFKGLELQATSCHTAEASNVDDAFDAAFDRSSGKRCGINGYYSMTMAPADSTFIETYSDAKSTLVGIIDSPETLKSISAHLMYTLIWVLHKRIAAADKGGGGELPASWRRPYQNPSVRSARYPITWYKQVVGDAAANIGAWGGAGGASGSSSGVQGGGAIDSVGGGGGGGSGSSAAAGLLSTFGSKESNPQGQGQGQDQDRPYRDRANSPDIEALMDGFSIDFSDDDDADGGGDSGASNAPPALPPSKLPSFSAVPPPAATRERHASQLAPAPDGGSWEASDVTRNLVLWCFDALHGLEARKRGHCTPQQVVSVFRGMVPVSSGTPELDPELMKLALQAFRYAVKLALDQALIYPGEVEPEDADEVEEALLDFDAGWHLGPEDHPDWTTAVGNGVGSLFSVAMKDNDSVGNSGIVLSHLMTTQQVAVHVGSLNRAAVEGQWASLHLELLYLANDDDERYSIQAHPTLLRNLTVQAADPPLGYPIYNRRIALQTT